jgi:GNAT superfamily N-acetyltransferase
MSVGASRAQEIEIKREALTSPAAKELITALNAELSARYPEPGANHFRLDAGEVAPGHGAFLIAYRDNTPLACGAVRLLSPERAEVKRMYVEPASRGLGVGRHMLDALEEEARQLGARELVLETGGRQPEAIALYSRAGFSRIDAFGDYEKSPLSVCMRKTI